MALNKVTKKIISGAAVVVLLLVGLYIYNVVLTSEEEAVLTDIRVPGETRSVRSFFDVTEQTKLRWKDAITLRGWVAKENVNQEPRDMYLVLKSKDSSFIYKIDKGNLSRPDVTKALKLDGTVDNHGFVLTFPSKDYKGGTYKLGFIIEDKTGKYFCSSNKILTIPEDGNAPLKVEKGTEPKTISNKVTVNINATTTDMNYYFDKVEKAEEYVHITGWAFLKGMNANTNNTYVLLKRDKDVLVFDVKIRERKDVTKTFIKEKLSLDSAGFTTSIPVESLQAGKYQVGLYITNGNQCSMRLTSKFIEVGK